MSKVLVSITVFAAIAAAWGFAFRALTVFFRRESTGRHDGPTRVQLIDFLALFVALTPALVFLSVAARTGWPPWPTVLGLGVPLLLALLTLWWQAVRLLSNLAVHDAVRRALFLGILFPTMLGAAPIAAVFLLGSLSLLSAQDPPLGNWLAVALLLAAVGAMLGLGIRYVHSGVTVVKSHPRAAEFSD